MRAIRLFFLILLPLSASERGLGGEVSADSKATIQFLERLRDQESGAFKQTAKDKPSLRATNGAVKALKALGQKVTDIEKIQKFVLGCYDAKTGAFAEPDGKPDATITSIGIIVACEVGIDHEDILKAMDYVQEKAASFEEVRIAAAAVEAWGAMGIATKELQAALKNAVAADGEKIDPFDVELAKNGMARELASYLVTMARINPKYFTGLPGDGLADLYFRINLSPGQRTDGGWSKKGEKASDIESTYRVMRAFKMLDAKPKDIPQLRKFLASHRNQDGGSATKPGEVSSASGTYYSVIVSKWLDDMAK